MRSMQAGYTVKAHKFTNTALNQIEKLKIIDNACPCHFRNHLPREKQKYKSPPSVTGDDNNNDDDVS